MALRSIVGSPEIVPGCLLWFDAADTSTFTPLSGSQVTQWRDKSGSARNTNNSAGAVTYNATGLNGRPTMVFNGSSWFSGPLIYNSGSDYHAFVVGTVASNSVAHSRIFSIGRAGVSDVSSSDASLVLYAPSPTQLGAGRNSTLNILNINAAGTPFLAESFSQSNTLSLTAYGSFTPNTAVYGTSTNLNLNNYMIGQTAVTSVNERLTGTISEIMLFNRTLTQDEQLNIETSLARKWGLTGLMVTGHPGQRLLTINPLLYSSFFNPAAIAGCRFWFDATDTSATGMTLSGTTVTQWRDKSGNGLHTSASNGTMTLVNNSDTRRTTINFPANSSFTMPNVSYTSSIRSIFCVITIGNLQGGGVQYLVLNGNTMLRSVQLYSINSGFQFNGSFLEVFATANNPAGFFNNTSIVYCGTTSGNSGVTVNGAAISLSVNNSSSSFQTGSAAQTIGGVNPIQISEMIVYDGSLSADDRINIESYLANKYNLDSRLIAGHRNFTLPAGAPRDIISIRRGFIPGILVELSVGNAILGIDYFISRNNGRIVCSFIATTKTMTFTVNTSFTADILLIAGGGSGGTGGAFAGGGGAGGVIYETGVSFSPGNSITLTVGAGGVARFGAESRGFQGTNSVLAIASGTSRTAIGGGAGGGQDNTNGTSGGSGGGGGSGEAPGGSGVVGQGFSVTTRNVQGGAGAGGSNDGHNGGPGREIDITGTPLFYGGGGGGKFGVRLGGVGGGGNTEQTGTDGLGGGGGGGSNGSGNRGGNGVFIMYLNPRSFRFFQFNITQLKDTSLSFLQFSEFRLYNNGTMASLASATSTGIGNFPSNEGPTNAIDNLTATKVGTFTIPFVLVITNPTPIIATHFSFVTANDHPGREPARWVLSGSVDGTNWIPIHTQSTTYLAPDARFTESALFQLIR